MLMLLLLCFVVDGGAGVVVGCVVIVNVVIMYGAAVECKWWQWCFWLMLCCCVFRWCCRWRDGCIDVADDVDILADGVGVADITVFHVVAAGVGVDTVYCAGSAVVVDVVVALGYDSDVTGVACGSCRRVGLAGICASTDVVVGGCDGGVVVGVLVLYAVVRIVDVGCYGVVDVVTDVVFAFVIRLRCCC